VLLLHYFQFLPFTKFVWQILKKIALAFVSLFSMVVTAELIT